MARSSGKGASRKGPVSEPDSDDVLWAKYLDYCSARVCEMFTELEEDHVFQLARVAEREAGVDEGALSFREIAELLVEKLLEHMTLPDFESWARSYREHPEKYDPYLIGLWRTAVQTPANQGGG